MDRSNRNIDDGNTVTETACAYGEESCTLCSATCTNVTGTITSYCGDGSCKGPETVTNCITDCPITCGDGTCNSTINETCSSCEVDCACVSGYTCSNGTCTKIVASSGSLNDDDSNNPSSSNINTQTKTKIDNKVDKLVKTRTWKKTETVSLKEQEKFESEQGFTKQISKNERVKIKVGGSDHHIGVTEITKTTVTIQIASTPQEKTLTIGDERKFDIDNDGTYDIYAKLNDIIDDKADITMRAISETVTSASESKQQNQEASAQEKQQNEKMIWTAMVIGIIIAILIIGALTYFSYKKSKQESKIVQSSSFSQSNSSTIQP